MVIKLIKDLHSQLIFLSKRFIKAKSKEIAMGYGTGAYKSKPKKKKKPVKK